MSEARGARLNLKGVDLLLAQGAPIEMGLLRQILAGFGLSSPIKATTAEEALNLLHAREVDMLLVDAALPEMGGYELIKRLRRAQGSPNRLTPVILTAGYIRNADVKTARDCGANFVMVKPITPQVLFERILWLARERRPFVEAEAYHGPDRRFHAQGAPEGVAGRRACDADEEDAASAEPHPSAPDQQRA